MGRQCFLAHLVSHPMHVAMATGSNSMQRSPCSLSFTSSRLQLLLMASGRIGVGWEGKALADSFAHQARGLGRGDTRRLPFPSLLSAVSEVAGGACRSAGVEARRPPCQKQGWHLVGTWICSDIYLSCSFQPCVVSEWRPGGWVGTSRTIPN